jgi:hypothetical protein
MKLLLVLMLLVSFNAFSHCGACGDGTAKDHHEKGEDASHHDEDEESKELEDEVAEEDEEEESMDD